MFNPWKLLGVHRETPREDIRSSFHNAMKLHHPDKGGDPTKAAELTAAYKLLLDEKKLKQYLKELALVGTTCFGCGGKGYQFKSKGLTGRLTTPCVGCGGGGFVVKAKGKIVPGTWSVKYE